MRGMVLFVARYWFVASLAVTGSLPQTGAFSKTVSDDPAHLAPVTTTPAAQPSSAETAMAQSLRNDIDRHPGDFVVFPTQSSADRFLATHADAQRETDRRVAERGIVGYWQGKTLVILPGLTN